MKTLIVCISIAFITALNSICVSGCKAQNIQVVHNDMTVTNYVPFCGFNDENYIWENWQFGTNSVEKLD